MNFSTELQLMIAKTDYNASDNWLPLWIHSVDVYEVISQLVERRYYSVADICGIDYQSFKKTAQLLAILHDIGKATPVFQDKISCSLKQFRSVWESYNINIPHYNSNDYGKTPHAKASENILLANGFHQNFASVVGGHHGMPALDESDIRYSSIQNNSNENFIKVYKN